MLLTVTPDDGTNVVLPDPISTIVYLYPTGISTAEFKGIVKFIAEELESKIVLLTSSGSKVNPDVLVITVLLFSNCGSRSNLKSTEFQSIPSPARSGYPPAAPLIALVTAVVTNACVARFAVFGMPWTSVVSALCAVIAAFLFTTSAASASTRV